jgi:hypothetical protein
MHKLDMHEAEQSFFTSVDLLKKASVLTNDLYARNSVILPQLWASNRVFVRGNGEQNGLHMDLRDRLVSCFHISAHTYVVVLTADQGASAAFDNFWWWRAHFGHSKLTEEREHSHRPLELYGSKEQPTRQEGNATQSGVPFLDSQLQQTADSLVIPEDTLQGLMDWPPMGMENDFLPLPYWPTSGFDYGGMVNLADVSTDNMQHQYQMF